MGYVDLRSSKVRVQRDAEPADSGTERDEDGQDSGRSKGRIAPVTAAIKKALDHPMADYGFLLSAISILVVLGLIMVLSASNVLSYQQNDGNGYAIFVKQAIVAALGVGIMIFASRLRPALFRKLATVALIASLVLLVAVLIPGIGSGVHGQRNWIELGGPFRLQPSEFAKFAMVVWTAKLLTDRHDLIDGWRSLLWPFGPVTGLIVVLVVLEGDLGTAMILMAIMAGMLLIAGAPKKVFAALGALVLLAILALSLAAPYRMQRFLTWLDPGSDPTGAGWQIIHGHYALATGGWWGVGLGGSREKWGFLPEAQTDFILAVLGEELGIVGTLMTLCLFAVITFFVIRIAMRSNDRFVQLASAGVGLWIIAQALLNIGAVLGALPIAGVPLPLVSNGGSSLAVTLGAFGMVLAFARSEPRAVEYIAQKRESDRKNHRVKFRSPDRNAAENDEQRPRTRSGRRTSGERGRKRTRGEQARKRTSGERRHSRAGKGSSKTPGAEQEPSQRTRARRPRSRKADSKSRESTRSSR